MMNEIARLPFVKKVALSRGFPTDIGFSTALMDEETDMTLVSLLICDTEAFRMWGFEIKEDFELHSPTPSGSQKTFTTISRTGMPLKSRPSRGTETSITRE